MAQLLAGIFKLESEKYSFCKRQLEMRKDHQQESHMILFAVGALHFDLMRPMIGSIVRLCHEHLTEQVRTTPE